MAKQDDMYERLGGDPAWQQWFSCCAVDRVRNVDNALAEGLSEHITIAMKVLLEHTGYASAEFESDDPVAQFDSYFLLESKRKEAVSKKPLKQMIEARMDDEGIPLKQVVCGVLFSPRNGYIRDIVRDWIATVKGWKWRSVTQEDGKRKIVREGAGHEEVRETGLAVSYVLGLRLDKEVLTQQIDEVFSSLEITMGVEKFKLALLLYVTAHSLSLDNPGVLGQLGVAKSQAYKLKKECLRNMEIELEKKGVRTDDVMFASILMKVCEKNLGETGLSMINQ